MEHTERQEQILAYMETRQFATVAELASLIFASEATVRREIRHLEERGCLKSVYGGVVAAKYGMEPVPISMRDGANSAQKERLAERAALLVRENTTVLLDSSSTARRICRHIKGVRGLTVITSNLRVCEALKDSSVRVICTGGTLLPKRECFAGHFAEEFLRTVHADIMFFSAQGLSDGVITDGSEEEVSLRRTMFSRSKEIYFLADRSKIGKTFPFTLCTVKDVTGTILEG